MVDRVQMGERGGGFGIWVSKPGYDVKTASPGQFLLDSNSQVFQSVLTGTTALRRVGGGIATPVGTYTYTASLPAAFASFSNLFIQTVFYGVSDGGVYFSSANTGSAYLKYRATGGIVTLSIVFLGAFPATLGDPITFYASWSVFRAQF